MSAERSLEAIVDMLRRRELLELSWSELTTAERWAVGHLMIRQTIASVAMLIGVVTHEPALTVLGAALFLDARLRFGAREG